MSKNVLLTLVLIIFLSLKAIGGDSNTYIRLHDTISYDLSTAEDIITSAGGKIIWNEKVVAVKNGIG